MTKFAIEWRTDTYTSIEADRVQVDGGALVFTNGDILNPELVLAFAPGAWLMCLPHDECDHDEDDD